MPFTKPILLRNSLRRSIEFALKNHGCFTVKIPNLLPCGGVCHVYNFTSEKIHKKKEN